MPTRLLEYEGTWEELAAHAQDFRGRRLRLLVILDEEEMPDSGLVSPVAPTARELLKLPREERDRILKKQAALMEEEYRTNPDLTDFEAYGPGDLFDEHPENGAAQ